MNLDLTLLRKAVAESDFSSLYNNRTIDQMLVHIMDYMNPLRQMLSRKPGSGQGYHIRTRTPGTTGATDVDDTDTLSEQTGTYSEVYFPYKTLGTQGKITRRVQKTGKLVSDLMADEMEGKAKELRDLEEYRMFWGN